MFKPNMYRISNHAERIIKALKKKKQYNKNAEEKIRRASYALFENEWRKFENIETLTAKLKLEKLDLITQIDRKNQFLKNKKEEYWDDAIYFDYETSTYVTLPMVKISTLGNLVFINKLGYFAKFDKKINSNDYLTKSIKVDGNERNYLVHRIVASTFIPIPLILLEMDNKKPEVNHLDGIKYHNQKTNLEWVTQKYNSEHAAKIGLINTGAEHENSVIYQGTVVVENKHLGKKLTIAGRREMNELFLSHSQIKLSVKRKDYHYCGIQWTIVDEVIKNNDPELLDAIKNDKPYMESKRLPYLAESEKLSFVVYGVLELKSLGFDKSKLFNCFNSRSKIYGGYRWSRITHSDAEKYPRGVELSW